MKGDVVVLVHGIRDLALWLTELAPELQKKGYEVRYANYGRFGLFDFLGNGDEPTRIAKDKLSSQFIRVRDEFPDKPIHVIAHSFGSYLVTLLLQERSRMTAPLSAYTHFFDGRLIFCGSVADANFQFANHADQFQGKVVNEVGTRDFWPAIARFVSDHKFGAPGTYGFKDPGVIDRWHTDFGHGDYLTAQFCRDWWIPILDGLPPCLGAKAKPLPWWVDWMASYTLTQVRPWLITGAIGTTVILVGVLASIVWLLS
ncbi:alpha/beta hydrolase [Bradyrhizobium sp. USDA 4454]